MAGSVSGEFIGRVIGGRFRLESLLGRGASAEVYLAVDTRLRRRVAVKVLHRSVSTDQQFVRRFRSEAQLAARLTHPNIMVIHDWHDGISETETGDTEPAHLVTEYLDGGSLREILDRHHKLSISQATLVGIEAARALAYAHSQGIVHRDIKPANLLFTSDGVLRIADFGLARALAEAALTEPTGGLVGTARYSAPEQIGGGALDGRADVYSLMLVIIEAATGETPFRADTPLGVLMARHQQPVIPPESLGGLGEALTPAGVIDPNERIDAATLVRRLERATRGLARPERIPLVVPSAVRSIVDTDLTQHVDVKQPVGPVRPIDPAHEDRVGSESARPLPSEPEAAEYNEPTQKPTEDRPSKSDSIADLDENKETPKTPRRWLRILVPVLIAAIAAGSAVGWRAWSGRPQWRNVPAVVSLSAADAKRSLEAVDLTVKSSVTQSETIEKGDVISQNPLAAEKVEAGTFVELVISSGPAPRLVPELQRLSVEAATQLLENVQLVVGTAEEVFDEKVLTGIIVSSEPAGSVARDSSVNLVISKGPEPRVVPNITGMTPDDAQAALPKGLTGVVVQQSSVTVPAGTVIAANYKPGSELPRGSQVKIIVSTGPPLVKIPATKGLSVSEATQRLRAAGLVVAGVDGPPDQPVTGTQPSDGKSVKPNSEVRIQT